LASGVTVGAAALSASVSSEPELPVRWCAIGEAMRLDRRDGDLDGGGVLGRQHVGGAGGDVGDRHR
jgi:hypothetical protein